MEKKALANSKFKNRQSVELINEGFRKEFRSNLIELLNPGLRGTG
jgi:hypothetical protein